MNNSNAPALIRTLIIFGLCIPLAVVIGYLSTQWQYDQKTMFWYGGILLLIFLTPILLRWHHFLLIVGWNFGMTLFFLPGSPPVWLLFTALSLGISVLHRAVDSRARFISAPEITWSLVFLLGVVFMTSKLTGGMGLRSWGGEVSGGKHYVLLIFGILGYFALTAIQIPPRRVRLYIGLFFLAGCFSAIGDLAPYVPSQLYFLFAFFPVTGYDMENVPGMLNFHPRFAGLGMLGLSGFLFMIARYGVRGIFLSGKPWRWLLLGGFVVAMLCGGFRSHVILCGLTFTVMFFMERMHRTNVMPVFIFCGLIGITLLIPFADKLPFTFQRSLAFLPLHLSQAARSDAEGSSDWRLDIWRDTYPKVPKYLLLGKGYAISKDELAIAKNKNFNRTSTSDLISITQNYHSGPLSILMPFGAWGAIAVLWFWVASMRALYRNYRHGDPAFKSVNIFLFAYFMVNIFMFLVVFGSLESGFAGFAAIIGLSVSINGGIRKPVSAPAAVKAGAENVPRVRPPLQPLYQR